jgi:hypothetical protein
MPPEHEVTGSNPVGRTPKSVVPQGLTALRGFAVCTLGRSCGVSYPTRRCSCAIGCLPLRLSVGLLTATLGRSPTPKRAQIGQRSVLQLRGELPTQGRASQAPPRAPIRFQVGREDHSMARSISQTSLTAGLLPANVAGRPFPNPRSLPHEEPPRGSRCHPVPARRVQW